MIEGAPFKEVDPFQDSGRVHGDPDKLTDPTEAAHLHIGWKWHKQSETSPLN